ncbi:hypothetical protein EI94DRAFT_1708194 [Lactarius quietus]|nr:hypothetical protein EI94DRAFT_1708194 [Lactarius quietus]
MKLPRQLPTAKALLTRTKGNQGLEGFDGDTRVEDSIQKAITAREGPNTNRMSCSPTNPTFGDPLTVALPFNLDLAKVLFRPPSPPPLPPLPLLPCKKGGALPTGCGGPKPISGDDELWFLSWEHLVKNIISAQKAEDGTFSWVEFPPPFHSHLVKCAVVLVPHPVCTMKRVMFVFLLELLNQEDHLAFFKLQKGGCKANNAQKEKQCLARKQSHAVKCEREWEGLKVASLPACKQICVKCGHKFTLCKTAKKHKCSDSKVVHVKEAEGTRVESCPDLITKLSKLASSFTPHTPTVTQAALQLIAPPLCWSARKPSNNTSVPLVTGDLGGPFNQPPVPDGNIPCKKTLPPWGSFLGQS